jgi:hypothetical protein
MTKRRPAPPAARDDSAGGVTTPPASHDESDGGTAIEDLTARVGQLVIVAEVSKKLAAWQKRCREMGVEEPATSIEKCKRYEYNEFWISAEVLWC